jgi:hypothetical protein
MEGVSANSLFRSAVLRILHLRISWISATFSNQATMLSFALQVR